MARPGGVEYSEDAMDRLLEDFTDTLTSLTRRASRAGLDVFLTDLEALTPAEFMKRYHVSRAEYEELVRLLEEAEEEDGGVGEDVEGMDKYALFLGLAVAYLARDVELDVEVESYRAVDESLRDKTLYLNWVTMGDDRVCPECEEYEAKSPYLVYEFPHVPHPYCRCYPEPCDEHGNPVDLYEYSETDLEYFEEIMEEFEDVGIDLEVMPTPPLYTPIL